NQNSIPLRPGVCFWMRPGSDYAGRQNPDDRLGVMAIHFELIGPDGRVHRTPQSIAAAGLGEIPSEAHRLSDVAYGDAVMRRIVELMRQAAAGISDASIMDASITDADITDADIDHSNAAPTPAAQRI